MTRSRGCEKKKMALDILPLLIFLPQKLIAGRLQSLPKKRRLASQSLELLEGRLWKFIGHLILKRITRVTETKR